MKIGRNYSNQRYSENVFIKDECDKNIPKYLEHDINQLLEGIKNNSCLLDCMQDEVDGSINNAQWSGEITNEQAELLRNKYL